MKISRFLLVSAFMVMGFGAQVAAQGFYNPLLICRAHQCAASTYAFSKSFLFNALEKMMTDNIGHSIRVCDADPYTHACLRYGVRIPAQASFAQANITIPEIYLSDVKLSPKEATLNMVWDYRVKVNTTYPRCSAASTQLSVPFVNKVQLRSAEFGCGMTETGRSLLNATYDVDYIDFDYGLIGAYYTIGTAGTVRGGRSGYVLMAFGAKTTVDIPDEAFEVPAPRVANNWTAPLGEPLYIQPIAQEVVETAPQSTPAPVMVDDYIGGVPMETQEMSDTSGQSSRSFFERAEDFLYF